MEVRLSGKRIFVTGGTSTLGRVFVRRALEEGAQIFFSYFQNQEEADRLRKLGAVGFQVDLAERPQIDELKRKIRAALRAADESPQPLDAIVHNAAIVRDHTIQNMTEEEWDQTLSVNLSAVYYLTKKFLPFLFKKPRKNVIASPERAQQSLSSEIASPARPTFGGLGRAAPFVPLPRNDSPRKILTVVSRVGLHGGFGEANYAAAKGGLIALTKTLAQELGRKHILVNGINPGFMRSRMTEAIPQEVFDRHARESVLGSISDPLEVSNFMIYLLSDCFQHVSGQIFHFDSRKV